MKPGNDSFAPKDRVHSEIKTSTDDHQAAMSFNLGEIKLESTTPTIPVVQAAEPKFKAAVQPDTAQHPIQVHAAPSAPNAEHAQPSSNSSLPVTPQVMEIAKIKSAEREGSVELFLEESTNVGAGEKKDSAIPKPGGQKGKKMMKHPKIKLGPSKALAQAPSVQKSPSIPMSQVPSKAPHGGVVSSAPQALSGDGLDAITEEDVNSSSNLGESKDLSRKDSEKHKSGMNSLTKHADELIITAHEACGEVSNQQSLVDLCCVGLVKSEKENFLLSKNPGDKSSDDGIPGSIIPVTNLNVSSDSEYSISSIEDSD